MMIILFLFKFSNLMQCLFHNAAHTIEEDQEKSK